MPPYTLTAHKGISHVTCSYIKDHIHNLIIFDAIVPIYLYTIYYPSLKITVRSKIYLDAFYWNNLGLAFEIRI